MMGSEETTVRTARTFVKKYHRHILWIVLGILFALDILTTSISIYLGNFEKNPFMVPFVTNPGLHGMVKIVAYLFLFVVVEGAVGVDQGGFRFGRGARNALGMEVTWCLRSSSHVKSRAGTAGSGAWAAR